MITTKMTKAFLFFFGMVLCVGSAIAQESTNQLDANGKRHGVWKKYFAGGEKLRYEGQFDHGKEVGTFKFYCESCKKPSVVKEFSGNSNKADVTYFTESGKLVSEGKMEGKQRVGEWLYYQKKTKGIMTREFYVNGELDGVKTTFYPNQQMTEELTFQKGIKQGANNYYSPEGVLIKKLLYTNNQLNGPAEYYDAGGNVTIKGQYLKGKKHGLWKYYKNGKVTLEETYPKPIKRN